MPSTPTCRRPWAEVMGEGAISVRTVAPIPLAAVRRRVTAATVADEVVKAPVWALLTERGLNNTGETVVIYYDDGAPEMALHRPEGVEVDVGVVVTAPFEGDRTLQCVSTPAGRAAHARHVGHYALLPVIHADIRAWCCAAGLPISGINWERYAHWH